MTNKLPQPSNETLRLMSSPPPWRPTDIHWPRSSGSTPARWIAALLLAATEQHGPHLPGTDVMIAEAYLARVRELLLDSVPGDVPAAAAGRHLYRAYRLSGHAHAADGRRTEELDGAWRERRAPASRSS